MIKYAWVGSTYIQVHPFSLHNVDANNQLLLLDWLLWFTRSSTLANLKLQDFAIDIYKNTIAHLVSTKVGTMKTIRKSNKILIFFDSRTTAPWFEWDIVDMMLYTTLLGNKAMHAYNGNMISSPRGAKKKKKNQRRKWMKSMRLNPSNQDTELKERRSQNYFNKLIPANANSLTESTISQHHDEWTNENAKDEIP